MSAEGPVAEEQRPRRDQEARQEAPQDPQQRLLALPGIIATRIPNRESLDRLQKFLQENQPCNPPQVNCCFFFSLPRQKSRPDLQTRKPYSRLDELQPSGSTQRNVPE